MGIITLVFLFAFYKRYAMMKAMSNKPESEKLKILNDNDFNSTIKKGVSIVDFWAPWCAPCRVQGPIVSELAEEIGDKVNICKLDVDQNKKVASKFGIRSIPTIIIFKDGEPLKQFQGIKSKKALLNAIKAHI